MQELGVSEFHLSLTHGRPSTQHLISNSPTGAAFWAWIHKRNDIDNAWKRLVNVMSGQFCASTNFMVESLTASPKWSLQPEGTIDTKDYEIRYSVLPREITCTENLTPWLKLLPCKNRAGIAMLLNPHSIYDTDYHSLQTHLRVLEDTIQLTQTLELVFDPLRTLGTREWTLESLMGKKVDASCNLASTSEIYVFGENTLDQADSFKMIDGEKVST